MYVSAETSRRVACDASVVVMHHDGDGQALDVGRKNSAVPSSIRRALVARDVTCQFPGCTARRCDAHHVNHWADGGPRASIICCGCVGGIIARCTRAATRWFLRPPASGDGRLIARAPGASAPPCGEGTSPLWIWRLPMWDGTPFDVGYAIDVLWSQYRGRDGASAAAEWAE